MHKLNRTVSWKHNLDLSIDSRDEGSLLPKFLPSAVTKKQSPMYPLVGRAACAYCIAVGQTGDASIRSFAVRALHFPVRAHPAEYF